MAAPTVHRAAFPTPSKTASDVVRESVTTATCMSFSDKILITITSAASGNKLAHWVHVPLAPSSNTMDPAFNATTESGNADSSLLPRSDLTATTSLGGTKRDDEVVGQTLATTIASAILMKRRSEERMLVLGMGLPSHLGRDGFEEIVGLVLSVL